MVGIRRQAIAMIERETMPIYITYIGRACLQQIANELGTTADYILHGELPSERATRDNIRMMFAEGEIQSEEKLQKVEELALKLVRLRGEHNTPLKRPELSALLEALRDDDGN